MTTEYHRLRRNILFSYLDKYPDAPSRTLARMIFRDNPFYFHSIEDARKYVRVYRGTAGKLHRLTIRETKYYKHD
jgi:hypothetical protein